jgi:hypothetical protein
MKMTVFWVAAQCSLVEVYQRFRSVCCLHHQGDRTRAGGGKSQKTVFLYVRHFTLQETKAVLKFLSRNSSKICSLAFCILTGFYFHYAAKWHNFSLM